MKKALSYIQQWFSYFGDILSLFKKIAADEPGYIVGYCFNTIVSAVWPFNNILFIKLLLDEFTNDRRFKIALLYAVLMCSINFLLRFLTSFFNRQEQKVLERVKAKFLLGVEEVTMEVSYDKLENSKIIDQRQKAMEIFYPTMSGFMDLFKTMSLARTMFACFLQIVGYVSILFTLHPLIIVIMLVICLFSIVIESKASEKEFNVWNVTLVHYGRKLGYLQDVGTNLAYAKELRIYQVGDWLVKKLIDVIGKIVKEVSTTVRGFVIVACVSNILIILLNGGLYLYFYFLATRNLVSIADVSVYFNTVNSFILALLSTSSSVVVLFKSGHYLRAYIEYINMGMDKGVEKASKQNDTVLSQITPENMTLEFREVWFRYPGTENDILKGVTFTINPRSKTAIVGDNGAGKTTVIKLILKFYKPNAGTILLNGIDIQKISDCQYYQYISVVFQDFKILNYSLAENIAFDKPCDKARLDQIMEDLELTKMVSNLPEGYETICGRLFGEEGIELSGGQGQKVAIARALFKESSFIILDEPTAMLSPASESEIFQNLNDLTIGKTAIFISHRMSSCRFCDNIIVLDKGKVVEEGNHDTLMEENGFYCKMFTTQANFYHQMMDE